MHALSLALIQAHRTHAALLSAEWAQAVTRVDTAYAVQDEVAAEMGCFAAGRPDHWKSGGPSRDIVLTHAALPPSGVTGNGTDLSARRFHLRAVEPEIALRLARDVTPAEAAQITDGDVDPLIDAMCVTIEVVDSRWHEAFAAPALLRLADMQSHAALVVGDWMPYARRDWSAQRCTLTVGSAEPRQRTGTHTLADPAWLLPQWLKHLTRHGATAPAGSVVTTGTWAGAVPAQAGDKVSASFEGIGAVWLQL